VKKKVDREKISMAVGNLTRTDRFVNTLLLVAMLVLGLSGIIMLYGTWQPWIFDLHRMTGFSLVALIPWKGITIYRSLRRGMQKTFDRSLVLFVSLVFAHFMVIIIVLSLMWMLRLGPYRSLFYELIAWHWILGLAILPVLAFHVWRRWPSPQKQDFATRRDALRLIGVAGVGVLAGGLATVLARAQATEERPRRFTGSRGFGLFAGNDFPVTGESTVRLDADRWQLAVTGAVNAPLTFTYQDILARATQTTTETIDCTNGWYSVQDWQGLPLIDLLQEADMVTGVAGVRLVSITGYNHSYPLAEAHQILLATHVTGEILAPRHGFPVRAVVPGRRGWFWVKWLVQVEVLDSYWDVIKGILWSPRQVLRQM
jgi:DMSO/TMAO reductase YedYZ molybdopterin-dependent catalytic subunit